PHIETIRPQGFDFPRSSASHDGWHNYGGGKLRRSFPLHDRDVLILRIALTGWHEFMELTQAVQLGIVVEGVGGLNHSLQTVDMRRLSQDREGAKDQVVYCARPTRAFRGRALR